MLSTYAIMAISFALLNQVRLVLSSMNTFSLPVQGFLLESAPGQSLVSGGNMSVEIVSGISGRQAECPAGEGES